MSGWKPIATAPKDGTQVLLGGRWRPFENLPGGEWTAITARYSTFSSSTIDAEYQWVSDGLRDPMRDNINWTHWHPLPEPPGDAT